MMPVIKLLVMRLVCQQSNKVKVIKLARNLTSLQVKVSKSTPHDFYFVTEQHCDYVVNVADFKTALALSTDEFFPQ